MAEKCISCYELTVCKISCCKAPICEKCRIEWLKSKRQCMHCNADQIDFDTWVREYRVDSFDPQEFIHAMRDIDTTDDEYEAQFTMQDMLHAIRRQNNQQTNLRIEDIEFSDGYEPYRVEFGYTISSVDNQGNPTGNEITVTQFIDVDSQDMREQMSALLLEYRELANQRNAF